ncbi:hypothetical protein K438DRAFT_1762917 [Mycena galopus ATCC 62051]|nr:hypothetical protein K438DRAFT_1762917 [Mycena galopus ATCC 62051]
MRIAATSLLLLALCSAHLGHGTSTKGKSNNKSANQLPATSNSVSPSPSYSIPTSRSVASAQASTSITGTSVAGAASKPEPKLHLRAIAVVTAAVTGFFACVGAALFWLIKCRSKSRTQEMFHSDAEIGRMATTISPFTLITEVGSLSSGNATLGEESEFRSICGSTMRQAQMVATTEKMVEVEDQERPAPDNPPRESSTGRIWGLMSVRSISRRSAPDMQAQLHAATHRIDTLVTRIHVLEANSESARIICDEPPPEYH